jgi:hypothetical protein
VWEFLSQRLPIRFDASLASIVQLDKHATILNSLTAAPINEVGLIFLYLFVISLMFDFGHSGSMNQTTIRIKLAHAAILESGRV